MRYALSRVTGFGGDSGFKSEILDSESYTPIPGETYPKVGCGVRVGGFDTWWTTTPVTTILEESVNEEGYRTVMFKTKNSTYVWKEF